MLQTRRWYNGSIRLFLVLRQIVLNWLKSYAQWGVNPSKLTNYTDTSLGNNWPVTPLQPPKLPVRSAMGYKYVDAKIQKICVHEYNPWDCGCSWGCDMCKYSFECRICWKIK